MNNLPIAPRYSIPERLRFNVSLLQIIEEAMYYNKGINPFNDSYNLPTSSHYNPKKELSAFTAEYATYLILYYLNINRELLYMASLPFSESVITNIFDKVRFTVFESFFNESNLADDLIAEDLLIPYSPPWDNGIHYYRDKLGNEVDILFGIKEEHAYFLCIFIYFYLKSFSLAFPQLVNYMIQKPYEDITLYLDSYEEMETDGFNRRVLQLKNTINHILINVTLEYLVQCKTIAY